MESTKSELHEVTKIGIFEVQVCSLASEEDALAWVQSVSPSGTSKNWQKSDKPEYRPVDCANGGGRTHYVFEA